MASASRRRKRKTQPDWGWVKASCGPKVIANEYNIINHCKVIERRTIDEHKSNIKQKFGIDSSGGLVAFAIKYCDDNGLEYKNLNIQSKRSLLGF